MWNYTAPKQNCTNLIKNVLNHFVCIKLKLLSYNLPFLIYFIPLANIIGIKPAPGNHKSNLKKVGAIMCGCNTN